MAKAIEDAIDALVELVLESISLETAPNTVYTEGDVFDPTGLVLKLSFNGDVTDTVAYSEENAAEFTFAPAGELTTDVTSVTIGYAG